MQHPIGEHALLADSRTAALIDPGGDVAWLCWPRVDSTPLFFSILDEQRGGGLSVLPAQQRARVVSRRYHPRSLVLETVWEVDGARLTVEDALDLGEHPLLVRRLRAEGGDVDVAVGFRSPQWPGKRGSIRLASDVLEVTGVSRVAVRVPGTWRAGSDGATCAFRLHASDTKTVTLGAPEIDPRAANIDATLAQWQAMVPARETFNLVLADSRPDESTIRDLLGITAAVLLGLRQNAGGIVAAPTTSLPQWPASSRTWDYRYCWLRDASLAGVAMLRLGLVAEARGLGAFIGGVVTEQGPVPLVRVDGSAPPEEIQIAELTGYRGARPVRIGNAAATQAQLDVPGEVIELATALAARAALPDQLATAVPILAGWLTRQWREPDSGIWEIRGMPRRYTHSLITAMSGLEGAAALADTRVVAGDARAWRDVAATIGSELDANSAAALQLRLDGGGADAALAQVALLGGLDAVRPHVSATLDLIVERLDRGGLVDRYEGQPDTNSDPCAPFVFPTFWLSAALTAAGRDGSAWLDTALRTRGPFGLFGEVADPLDHTPLGNYPQVQSHAAFALAVTGGRSQRWVSGQPHDDETAGTPGS
jgi:GH15 family glucan-1,4-alpha-glucosidase